MSPVEAGAAITRHFGVPASAVKFITSDNHDLVKGKIVDALNFERAGEKLFVHFTFNVLPIDPARPLVADMISYETPWSLANKQLLHDAAVKKYGAPVYDFATSLWCGTFANNVCADGQAVLELGNTGLTLRDDRYAAKVNQLRDYLKRTKPNL